ncbi:MAG: riboflavin synthase, partial [Umezawaea sp.]
LTTPARRRPGDPVNLEVDVLAKYVERLALPHLRDAGPVAGTEGEATR